MLKRLFSTGEYRATPLQFVLDTAVVAGFFGFLLCFESLVEFIL